MRALAAVVLICFTGASSAAAAVSRLALDGVRVEAGPNATLPLSLPFIDDTGSPRTLRDAIGGTAAVVVFSDYTCTNLCGPILAFAAGGLEKSRLAPGKDFHLVSIGLDPKDGLEQARAMKASRIGEGTRLARASKFLIGKPDTIRAVTQAVGYHYVYDAEHDQFAHPAAAYVVTKEGRVVRVLSGLGLSGDDLRLALVDAGQGRVGTLLDQIALRCYGFDPARGIYTASISRLIAFAGAGTAMLLLGGILVMTFGRRQRSLP